MRPSTPKSGSGSRPLDRARDGALSLWLTYPNGTLAYIILTDQFPRNMFRDDGQCLRDRRSARAAAKSAISKGWDMRIDEPARQFFYMPLMHSECLADQDRCMRLVLTRMPRTGEPNLPHAKAHREVIRQFGRFPYRNEALSRETPAAEATYLRRAVTERQSPKRSLQARTAGRVQVLTSRRGLSERRHGNRHAHHRP